MVVIIVAALVTIFGGYAFLHIGSEQKLKTEITKLKEELTLLKSYGAEEQELIGKEIMTFRENFAR